VRTAIPDLMFQMKEVLISGDRVTVLGEFEGTPSGDLFGVPHSGKSFRVMTLNVQTIKTRPNWCGVPPA
jgi:predicted ester cyclase